MEKKMVLNENEAIEINGAKLTAAILEQLKAAQGGENLEIKILKAHIADAVCYMLTLVERYSEIDKESLTDSVNGKVTNLSYCYEELDYLDFSLNSDYYTKSTLSK